MKIFRVIMSLSVMALLAFAVTGCHNEPVEMGNVPGPRVGGPNNQYDNSEGIDFEDVLAKNRNNNNDPGTPDDWKVGADNLGPRNGEFMPVTVPGYTFDPIYFDYDRSDLKQSEMDKLRKVADFLRARPELGMIIEGHCDDRGSEEYNRALGERRAISLRDQLVRLGVPDENMKTMSYGKDRPAVQGTSSEARSRNRRGETIPARMQ